MNSNIDIFPEPKIVKQESGQCIITGIVPAFLSEITALERFVPNIAENGIPLLFVKNVLLHREEYVLHVEQSQIMIEYAKPNGAFYALMSLRQLFMSRGAHLPCCTIRDSPSLAVRGVLLDISRGKVPKLDTLYLMADKMALLKLNHLQLYIEGFSFAYPSFPEVWEEESAMTPDELELFDRYCRERFIELVPCQNSLGHMGEWINLPQYQQLASNNAPFELFGKTMLSGTLNPLDPESMELVKTMIQDISPCFSSPYFHVGLDETYGLEDGTCAEEAKKAGPGGLYLDYAVKLQEYLTSRGKQMMMWGDIVSAHLHLIEKLPKEIMVLDWGYSQVYPFDKRAKTLAENGLKFCLCPGTNSWSSFGGITDTMLGCIENAAKAAHKYGAWGLIVTDWGDGGHQQYLPVSCAGIAYTAALAWNETEAVDESKLCRALDSYIYEDEACVMGKFSLELGRYNRFEESSLPCRTMASLHLMVGALVSAKHYEEIKNTIFEFMKNFTYQEEQALVLNEIHNQKPFDYVGVSALLSSCAEQLEKQNMQCTDREIILREYKNTIRMISVMQTVRDLIYKNAFADNKLQNEALETMDTLEMLLVELIGEHCDLWLKRNKKSKMDESVQPFELMLDQVRGMIKECV